MNLDEIRKAMIENDDVSRAKTFLTENNVAHSNTFPIYIEYSKGKTRVKLTVSSHESLMVFCKVFAAERKLKFKI